LQKVYGVNIAMGSFRDTRNALLLAYDEDIISDDEEFVILYHDCGRRYLEYQPC
jgi:hypothetical protein